MVPFELAWLARVFGQPRSVAGKYGRHSGRTESFEDTWSLLMQLESGGTGQLTVTMATPGDYRGGSAFGVKGGATWEINRGELVLHAPGRPPAVHQYGAIGQVIEPTYAAEINAYVDAIQGGAPWLHGYADYQHAIATLAAAEVSMGTQAWTAVDPWREPARVLPR
jgi:predicted dehydrogenase